jgi:hypothetical protein
MSTSAAQILLLSFNQLGQGVAFRLHVQEPYFSQLKGIQENREVESSFTLLQAVKAFFVL